MLLACVSLCTLTQLKNEIWLSPSLLSWGVESLPFREQLQCALYLMRGHRVTHTVHRGWEVCVVSAGAHHVFGPGSGSAHCVFPILFPEMHKWSGSNINNNSGTSSVFVLTCELCHESVSHAATVSQASTSLSARITRRGLMRDARSWLGRAAGTNRITRCLKKRRKPCCCRAVRNTRPDAARCFTWWNNLVYKVSEISEKWSSVWFFCLINTV